MTQLGTKTIEYPFTPNLATLATATSFTFAAETLYLPETTSRAFRSVVVDLSFESDTAGGSNLTALLVGIKLGATAFTDTTITVTATATGERTAFHEQRDVTSYFTSNFGAGTSQTSQVRFTVTGPATINHMCKLIITYEADYNGVDTRVKTVRIPLESETGNLTSSAVELGTNQMPALDTFLPEATKVYRQIWFEVEGNDNCSGTTNAQLGMTFDSTEELDGTHRADSDAGIFYHRIWRPTVADTSVVHAIKARVTDATSLRYAHLAVKCYVTYEYSHTSSSTFLQSLVLPLSTSDVDLSAAGDKERWEIKNFMVEEPTTITLQQSGVQWWGHGSQGYTASLAVGGQTARGYVHAASTADMTPFTAISRVDSGSAAGAGITLARGQNTFTVDLYTNQAVARANSCVLYLNYISGKAANGDSTHNHSTHWLQRAHGAGSALIYKFTPLGPPNIPEATYWLGNVGYSLLERTLYAASGVAFALSVERQAGEGPAAGWERLAGIAASTADEELGEKKFWLEVTDKWLRYPADPRYGRMNLETARDYTVTFTSFNNGGALVNSQFALGMWVTYHAITFTWAGVLSSATNSITVTLHNSTDGTKFDSVVTSGAGNYSFTTYDSTENYFAEAKESSALLGRSDNDVGA